MRVLLALVLIFLASAASAHRQPAYLEKFALAELLVWHTEPGETADGWSALVMDPDQYIHRVAVNDFIGRNSGRVISISVCEMEVVEVISDGADGWTEVATNVRVDAQSCEMAKQLVGLGTPAESYEGTETIPLSVANTGTEPISISATMEVLHSEWGWRTWMFGPEDGVPLGIYPLRTLEPGATAVVPFNIRRADFPDIPAGQSASPRGPLTFRFRIHVQLAADDAILGNRFEVFSAPFVVRRPYPPP